MKTFNVRAIVVGVATAFLVAPAFAAGNNDTTALDVEPVILQLDSMSGSLFSRDKFFADEQVILQSIFMPTELIPRYSDAEIAEKMKLMPFEVPMILNDKVKSCIDLFAYKKRAMMTRCLANSQLYFPIFEKVLDRKGLPLELKYLPVVESAFNPIAVSSAGATGLWQLMYGTGKLMGLDVNTYVDERRDPLKATEAATKYLKKLYDMYGDWHLVLAAYNSGPGNVNKAIARAGGVKDFWAIMAYLPAETRSYVPLYIAAAYVLDHHKDYKLYAAEPNRDLYAVDTVLITEKVSLAHIASVLGISEDELQFLNPSVKREIIPYTKNGFPLNLPINYFAQFEAKKVEIMTDSSQLVREAPAVAAVPVSTTVHHTVRHGETLGGIATKYNMSVSALRTMNHLHGSLIRVGQRLKIKTTTASRAQASSVSSKYAQVFAPRTFEKPNVDSVADATIVTKATEEKTTPATLATDTNNGGEEESTATKNTEKINKDCGCIYHVVQPGDTLWNIAQKYDGVTVETLKADNSVKSKLLKVGEVLKIFIR